MGLFAKKERKPKVASACFVHIDGLNYHNGMIVRVTAGIDSVGIYSTSSTRKNPLAQYTLNYYKITNADIISRQEIMTVQQDAVGGAILGGLLVGGVGAIVGAAANSGTSKRTANNNYLIINYTPDGGDEVKALSFTVLDGDFVYRSWVRDVVNEIRFRIGLPDIEKKRNGVETVEL